ncbi:hypothetical protein FJ364_03935 [Candidatus Dependentiae bacterium]|nr:hypothetical protein [Candidatus Dependentiae bacterium]
MKTMWSLLALVLMTAPSFVVCGNVEEDTVWGAQERPIVTSKEEAIEESVSAEQHEANDVDDKEEKEAEDID